jgi:glyoxylase-like metal-dependent hydrolase (beta-lactamase superfamily II)
MPIATHVLIDGWRRVSPRFVFRGYDDDVQGPFVRPFLDEEGMLPGRFAALLVEAAEGPLLVDAGLGRFAGDHDAGHLRDELAALGVRPRDVRTVVVTHGHPDHVGGLTTPAGEPVFGEARHVVHAAEAAWWRSDAATGLPGDAEAPVRAALDALDATGLLDTVDGDAAVGTGVRAVAAPGHTPGHLAVVIGDALLWTGDAIVAALNVTHPHWVSAADMDPAASEATRRSLLARAADEGLVVAGSHLPAQLRVRRDAGGFAADA